MEQIQSETIQMVTIGMMDQRFTIKTMMTMEWRQVGNITNFDPYDDADRMVDTDGDGHVNYCEYKWDTNPRDINRLLVKDNCVMRSRSSK